MWENVGVQRCQGGIRTFSNYYAVRKRFFSIGVVILYVAGEAVLCATAAVVVFFDSPRACSS